MPPASPSRDGRPSALGPILDPWFLRRSAGNRLYRRGGARAARPAERLLARGQLPVGRPDLPARQPAAAPAARARARQAAAARALGHHARAELRLRAHEPRDPRARPERDLRDRPRPRRPRPGGEHLPRGHLHRGLPEHRPGRGGAAPALPPVLVPRRRAEPRGAGDAGLDPRGRRARLRPGPRLRRGVRQPGPARLLRGRRRRGGDRARWPRAGTRTSSSTRAATAPCCRCFT